MNEKTRVLALINSVVAVSTKFIDKVETGRARSKETYRDMLKLREQALHLNMLYQKERG